MSVMTTEQNKDTLIKKLFTAGAHFGFSRRRRHPSVSSFLFGYKNNTAIIDLEQTIDSLNTTVDFVKNLGKNRSQILFVGNKPEARLAVKKAAMELDMPYVALRWIGGTFTNFKQIRKRVERMIWLQGAETSGELAKYTKKERLLFAKERKKLEQHFEGIAKMDKLPAAIFVIDVLEEAIAIAEAKQLGVPVITISNSDCDIRNIDYPIIANDGSKTTIALFCEKIVEAYKTGLKEAPIKLESEPANADQTETKTNPTLAAVK